MTRLMSYGLCAVLSFSIATLGLGEILRGGKPKHHNKPDWTWTWTWIHVGGGIKSSHDGGSRKFGEQFDTIDSFAAWWE